EPRVNPVRRLVHNPPMTCPDFRIRQENLVPAELDRSPDKKRLRVLRCPILDPETSKLSHPVLVLRPGNAPAREWACGHPIHDNSFEASLWVPKTERLRARSLSVQVVVLLNDVLGGLLIDLL